MGNDFTKSLHVDPSLQRTAKDVFQHEAILGFCTQWSADELKQVLLLYQKHHNREKEDEEKDNPNQDDAESQKSLARIQEEIHQMRNQLQQYQYDLKVQSKKSHDMKEAPDETTDEEPHDPLRSTLVDQIHTIEEQLKLKEQEYHTACQDVAIHPLRNILNQRLTFRPYHEANYEMDSIVQYQALLKERAHFHPATFLHAMTVDEEAQGDIHAYLEGNYEEDIEDIDDDPAVQQTSMTTPIIPLPTTLDDKGGHTDDSASESGSEIGSDDDEAHRLLAEEEEEELDSQQSPGEDQEASSSAESSQQQTPGEQDGEELKNNTSTKPEKKKEDSRTTQQPKLSAFKRLAQKKRNEAPPPPKNKSNRPPKPAALDATVLSPVFFGYRLTNDPLVNHMQVLKDKRDEGVARETNLWQQKFSRIESQYQAGEVEQDLKQRLEAILKNLSASEERYTTSKEKLEQAQKTAERAIDDVETIMSVEFQQEWTTKHEALDQAHSDEMKKWTDNRANVEAKLDDVQKQHVDAIERLKEMQGQDAQTRVTFHQQECLGHTQSLEELRVQLQQAMAEYLKTKASMPALLNKTFSNSGGKSAVAKQRSQLLFAEGQIKRLEDQIEASLVTVQEEQFLLECAEEQYESESKYRGLFLHLEQHDTDTDDDGEDGIRVEHWCLAMICKNERLDFQQKCQLIFQLYAEEEEGTKDAEKTRSLLSRVSFQHLLRRMFQLFDWLGQIHTSCEMSREAIAAFVHRAQSTNNDSSPRSNSSSPSWTEYDFHSWCNEQVMKNQYLAELMLVPWKFRHMGRYQRQHMSDDVQFRLGMISYADLRRRMAQVRLQPRVPLLSWRKEIMHERALARGQDDPLRTDYTKYLPQSRMKFFSNVVPLNHGDCYTNVREYQLRQETHFARMIQKVWRGIWGRVAAKARQRKHGFYYQKSLELENTFEEAKETWQLNYQRSQLNPISKMKIDAKVRMRQVKCRADGLSFETSQLVLVMCYEAVMDSLRQTEARFREMEIDIGYLLSDVEAISTSTYKDEEQHLPHPPVHQFLPEDISTALITKLQNAVKVPAHVQQIYDQLNAAASAKEAPKLEGLYQESSSSSSPEEPQSSSGEEQDQRKTTSENNNQILPSALQEFVHARRQQSQARKQSMLQGFFPKDLYATGETRADRTRREQLARSTSENEEAFYARLRALSRAFTDFKLNEFSLEIPTKRLLCAYICRFAHHDQDVDLSLLQHDLTSHFCLKLNYKSPSEPTNELARFLLQIKTSDFEHGILSRDMQSLHRNRWDATLLESSWQRRELQVQHVIEEQDRLVKRKGQNLDVIHQEGQQLLKAVEQKVQVSYEKLQAALKTHRWNIWGLHRLLRDQRRVNNLCSIPFVDRYNWYDRYLACFVLNEKNQSQCTQEECQALIDDFQSVAEDAVQRLVAECYLDASERTVFPIFRDEKESSSDNKRHSTISSTATHQTFELYNLVFQLALDQKGRYDSSDVASAKAYAHDIRHSRVYRQSILEIPSGDNKPLDIHLPLSCVVDYSGIRVHCAIKMPLDNIKWRGCDIRHMHQDHVYGTIDGGAHVKCQHKLLLDVLTAAGEMLNVASHHVKGKFDLTSRKLPSSCDLRGYVGSSKQMIVMHFHRAMPPEDPDETPHLRTSSPQTVFYRLLRPEFVQAYAQPLSPDAFSKVTHGTADASGHQQAITKATRYLIQEIIPETASDLWSRQHQLNHCGNNSRNRNSNQNNLLEFDLVTHIHERGINCRHLGWLRNQFAFQVDGSCTVSNGLQTLVTTKDSGGELRPGMSVRVKDQTYAVVAVDAHQITLDRVYLGPSEAKIPILANPNVGLECLECAAVLRNRLELEMIARALKHLAKAYLKWTLVETKLDVRHRQRQALVYLLNSITGALTMISSSHHSSDDGPKPPPPHHHRIISTSSPTPSLTNPPTSLEFWSSRVYPMLQSLFGDDAISFVDVAKWTTSKMISNSSILRHLVLKTLSTELRFTLSHACYASFDRSPCRFEFTLEDLVDIRPVVSGLNFAPWYVLTQARGCATQAAVFQSCDYSHLVVSRDHASGYWPLDERKSAEFALNRGSFSGNALLRGTFVGSSLVRQFPVPRGNFVNVAFPRRVVDFEGTSSHVAFSKETRTLPCCPVDLNLSCSMEAWICLEKKKKDFKDFDYDFDYDFDSDSDVANVPLEDVPHRVMIDSRITTPKKSSKTQQLYRIIMCYGRYTLAVVKGQHVSFTMNVHGLELTVMSTNAVSMKGWVHVVGTFDGTTLSIYVNGACVDRVEVSSKIAYEFQRQQDRLELLRQDLNHERAEKKAQAWFRLETSSEEYFKSEAGERMLDEASKRLVEHDRLMLKTKAAATTKPSGGKNPTAVVVPMTKKQARALAQKQYIKQEFSREQQDIDTATDAALMELERQVQVHLEDLSGGQVVVNRSSNNNNDNDRENATTLNNISKAHKILRIGASQSARSRDGRFHFQGQMAHVAYYFLQCLNPDQVWTHYYLASWRHRSIPGDVWFQKSLIKSQQAMSFSFRSDIIIQKTKKKNEALELYANTLVQSLAYPELSQEKALRVFVENKEENTALSSCNTNYEQRIVQALRYFELRDDFSGIVAILNVLPGDQTDMTSMFLMGFEMLQHILLKKKKNSSVVVVGSIVGTGTLVQWRKKFRLGRLVSEAAGGCHVTKVDWGMSSNKAQTALGEYSVHASMLCDILSRDPETFFNFNLKYCRALTHPAVVVEWIDHIETSATLTSLSSKSRGDTTEQQQQQKKDTTTLIMKLPKDFHAPALHLQDILTDLDFKLLIEHNTQLTSLNLTGCVHLTDASLVHVARHCQKLRHLEISTTSSFSDVGLKQVLMHCPDLRRFAINPFSGPSSIHFSEHIWTLLASRWTHLTHLCLSQSTHVTNETLATLGGNCQELVSLDISYCRQIRDAGCVAFASVFCGFYHFHTLILEGNRSITDVGLVALATKCTSLTCLNVEYCVELTSQSLATVTHNCFALSSLVLSECVLVTDAAFVFDYRDDGRPDVNTHMLGNLKEVYLRDCCEITDHGLACIGHRTLSRDHSSSGGLLTLDISGCRHVTDAGIQSLMVDAFFSNSNNHSKTHKSPDKSSTLVTLNLSYCPHLTNVSLDLIASHCPELRALYLNGLVHLSTSGPTTSQESSSIHEVFHACAKLEILELEFCHQVVTDDVLVSMSKTLWLEELNVGHCVLVTDVGVETLVRECLGLRKLNLSWCKRLTNTSVLSIQAHCQDLVELDLRHCPLICPNLLVEYDRAKPRLALKWSKVGAGTGNVPVPQDHHHHHRP